MYFTDPKSVKEKQLLIVSDEQIDDCAYLISKGVRALATLGTVEADPLVMLKTITRLESVSMRYDVKPFVIDRGDGSAEYGIAASSWVVNLYQWSLSVPEPQRSRIHGLMFGYSIAAIGHYEQDATYSGRCFKEPG